MFDRTRCLIGIDRRDKFQIGESDRFQRAGRNSPNRRVERDEDLRKVLFEHVPVEQKHRVGQVVEELAQRLRAGQGFGRSHGGPAMWLLRSVSRAGQRR